MRSSCVLYVIVGGTYGFLHTHDSYCINVQMSTHHTLTTSIHLRVTYTRLSCLNVTVTVIPSCSFVSVVKIVRYKI